jgi:4-carboxymuconolactone decarboxylase
MMKLWLALAAMFSAGAEAQPANPSPSPSSEVREVSPQLYAYTVDVLFGDNWKRAQLSPRDRSLVTLSILLANGSSAQMRSHVKLGLDNGLTPSEISGLITHLAFYAGWPRAMSAVEVTSEVFKERGIADDAIRVATAAELLPYDEAADAGRIAMVEERVGSVAPDLVRHTNGVLFRDLWRQPDLQPRDRSLVTVAALIAMGQAEQLPFHLNRAMDNGLTKEQAGEVISHSAFYAGWPRAMSAIPVAKSVFDSRAQ